MCTYVKDWFKPVFPIFLTQPLDSVFQSKDALNKSAATCFGTGMPTSGSLLKQVQLTNPGINRPHCHHQIINIFNSLMITEY